MSRYVLGFWSKWRFPNWNREQLIGWQNRNDNNNTVPGKEDAAISITQTQGLLQADSEEKIHSQISWGQEETRQTNWLI